MIKPGMTVEELRKFKYPNLVAEIMESGYELHRIAELMECENASDLEKVIEAKLRGDVPIMYSEAYKLAREFDVKMEYLFSHKLSVKNGKIEAYIRWNELKNAKEILKIYNELIENPELIDFMKFCITLTKKQREMVLEMLKERQGAS